MATLRLASFGVRGVVGESLTPQVVMDLTCAFATFVRGGRVLLGRDTRYSSPMIHSAVTASLVSAGCEVLDYGICPTPILQFSVRPNQAAGAISITGGHSPMGWNALTLIGADGAFIEPLGGEFVLDCYHAADFLKQDWAHMGSATPVDGFAAAYFDALERHLDAESIRKAGLTVLMDPVGGAGCAFLPEFARRLAIKLVPVNAEPSGYLAREPEPRPRSARQLASFIGHAGGDVGFVLSSDVGRMSIVTETGEPAGEEYSFAVIADHVLGKTVGPVVTNCCTTRMVDDVARKRGARLVKTPVGQAHVVAALADEQGVIGGEGSGSVALPAFSAAFDGFLMMGLVLEAMAQSRCKASDLLARLPRYHIVKRSVVCDSRRAYQALEQLKERLAERNGGHLDLTDGVRVDWEDGWLHVRPSRTQQLLRVISESTRKEDAERRAEEVVRVAGRDG